MKIQQTLRSNTAVRSMARGSRAHSRGVTLLEVIAYLGVAGMIIVGSVSMLTKAFSSSEVATAQQQIEAIHTSVKKLFGASATYGTADMTTNLVQAQALPTTLRIGGTATAPTVQNKWGGGVTVTGANNQFTLQYASVPRDACIEIITSLPINHWASATVGSNVATTFPIPLGTAATSCTAGTNTIALTSLN
jgi:type II secretory pathway pseudopilin PulG